MATILVRHFPSILSSSAYTAVEGLWPYSGHVMHTNHVWRIYLCAMLSSRFYHKGKFDLTDLTHPHTWYPLARGKKRRVLLHVGPTNSGKTYHALKRLELSSSGIYCGPLRLLAGEVADRLNKANVPCNLITGQEREEIDGAKHMAVTVEMADVSCVYKCAVIDEIQMIGCKTRGFSFTRALLGIPADELHLCGDPAAVPLIQEMLSVTGDIIQVEYYERLSPLIPLKRPLGSFSEIRTGDCVVAFSRHNIYSTKREIEAKGKHLCSVVYGSLPPETRTRQAKMFNDSSTEFDVLVASDAIGMGLNLNIHRIIFSTLKKFDGLETRYLNIPEIKQIAGRAGRYGSLFPNGEVTCMSEEDLSLLRSSLNAPSPCLKAILRLVSGYVGQALNVKGCRVVSFIRYLGPILEATSRVYILFSPASATTIEDGIPRLLTGLRTKTLTTQLGNSIQESQWPFKIQEQFVEKAKLSSDYFLSDCEDIMNAAAVIEDLPLGLQERYIFCISPVDIKDHISAQGLIQFAEAYAKKGLVHLQEIFTPETLRIPKTHNALIELESIHKVLDLYVWLGFHFKESFPDREVASSQKALCGMLIGEYLERLGWQKPKITRHSKQSQIPAKRHLALPALRPLSHF